MSEDAKKIILISDGAGDRLMDALREKNIEVVHEASIPDGYRENNQGLVVPEAESRERETWLYDGEEQKAFDRAARVANKKKFLQTVLICRHPRCVAAGGVLGFMPLKRVNIPGGYKLVCEHAERICLTNTHQRGDR